VGASEARQVGKKVSPWSLAHFVVWSTILVRAGYATDGNAALAPIEDFGRVKEFGTYLEKGLGHIEEDTV
jgi:hypothetical protein